MRPKKLLNTRNTIHGRVDDGLWFHSLHLLFMFSFFLLFNIKMWFCFDVYIVYC